MEIMEAQVVDYRTKSSTILDESKRLQIEKDQLDYDNEKLRGKAQKYKKKKDKAKDNLKIVQTEMTELRNEIKSLQVEGMSQKETIEKERDEALEKEAALQAFKLKLQET